MQEIYYFTCGLIVGLAVMYIFLLITGRIK